MPHSLRRENDTQPQSNSTTLVPKYQPEFFEYQFGRWTVN